ncbi:CBS domain-containing protein [Denitromonas ohlonensis]|jgi:CBS domain-containing protein|uniref:CBS domain-containing protein n=2 Tax=Denitromonas TaxID=139331 RepID=A0A557SP72_9RHOO|nr:CBS domain-containing protein [Denitromonas ohlonensis]TVO67154.1 CBS domain-containing protein [Denitromonas ohlonensis]TVO79214.1 CBS domain-containing protein [Denitromonas ohlonensis]
MPNRSVSKIIANRFFIAAPLDMNVGDAARLMREHRQGAVLVADDGRLLGICTERDIVFDVVANGLDPFCTPVSAVMTTDPVAIGPDMPFGHALHLMFEGGFRHVPVVDINGKVLGVISARDALEIDMIRFKQELDRREALAEIL